MNHHNDTKGTPTVDTATQAQASTTRLAAIAQRAIPVAFAARRGSGDAGGSGAPAAAPHTSRRRVGILAGLLATALLTLALSAPSAHAAKGWAFKEVFGAFNQPSLLSTFGSSLAVDGDGRLYVADGVAETVSRWNPDGTAADFSALSTNVIDGAGGADATPTGDVFNGFRSQIAVDNSGGLTDGNLYVVGEGRVDIFGPDGTFLGRLTGCGATPFHVSSGGVSGVAVDSGGTVYVTARTSGLSTTNAVRKYQPSGGPPVNADCTNLYFDVSSAHIAAGAGPSAGHIFVRRDDEIQKRDAVNGALVYGLADRAEIALDPTTGTLFAGGIDLGSSVVEFDASGGTAATEVSRLQDAGSTVHGIAITDSAELLYVARDGSSNIEVWEAVAAQEAQTGPPSLVSGAKVTVTGTVEPFGTAITDCYFEYVSAADYDPGAGNPYADGDTAPCDPEAASIPADLGSHAVTGELTGLLANGAAYRYRLVTSGAALVSGEDRSFETADTFTTDPVTSVTGTTATLNGTVKPEGVALTDCYFEYGVQGFSSRVSCDPEAGSIPNTDSDVSVSSDIADLEPSTVYRFRLVAENAAGLILTEQRAFTTPGPPVIVSQFPLDVTRTTATLQARINPAASPTTYHFQWGPDTGYGTRVPADFNLFVGAGSEPVTVDIPVSGLEAESVYHFRVVATNPLGTTTGPDQAFSTLNQDGLAWGRRYERVSPADKGPAREAGQGGGTDLPFRVTPDGEAIHYVVGLGFEDATFASEVIYRSDRGPDGWQLTGQISPSLEGSGPVTDGGASATRGFYNRWLARDLDCAFSVSSLPLTGDPAARVAIDAGGFNLYRRDADLSYDLVTDLAPTNADSDGANSNASGAYTIFGAAQDCSRVVFETRFKYPGVPFTSTRGNLTSGLYEWNAGTLGNPVTIPGPSGPEIPAVAGPGAGPTGGDHSHYGSVSEDGSRLYFTATSKLGGDVGKQAIFLREDGEPVIDVSQSQTATPNNADVRYQMATSDGAHVFFIGRYGLAGNGSSGGATSCDFGSGQGSTLGIGCDLYRYSVDSGELTDLSPSSNPADVKGASVAGVLDASADGSRVYFAAKGQLVPGKGQTFAQNTAAATRGYNVYLSDGGELSFVGRVAQADVSGAGLNLAGVLVSGTQAAFWASQTTPYGDHLLFQSSANITGYDSGGGEEEAYRYSAGTGRLECVSCRRDGQPTLATASVAPIERRRSLGSPAAGSPAISNDGSTVFFGKRDPLATGAVASTTPFAVNRYEWRDGQISLLAASFASGVLPNFMGAADDGTSVFLSTEQALLPWDTDGGVSDIYVARVGGGFPPPPTPPEPCDPLSGGACEGAGSGGPKSADIATPSFSGSGNLAERSRPNRCNRIGRRAKKLTNRARRLSRNARKVNRRSHRRAVSMNRRARRLGRRAKGLSKRARRCRAQANRQANTSRRAGK
jgi:hypothetical protein